MLNYKGLFAQSKNWSENKKIKEQAKYTLNSNKNAFQ